MNEVINGERIILSLQDRSQSESRFFLPSDVKDDESYYDDSHYNDSYIDNYNDSSYTDTYNDVVTHDEYEYGDQVYPI